MINEIGNWIADNLGWLILTMAVLVALFWNKMMKSIALRKIKKEINKAEEPEPFYGQPFAPGLSDLKRTAEQEIKKLEDEGKKLVNDEKRIRRYTEDQTRYINEQKVALSQRKSNLEMMYNSWVNQLEQFDMMIREQDKIDKQKAKDTSSLFSKIR